MIVRLAALLALLAPLPMTFVGREAHACSCVPPSTRFVTESGELPSDAVGVVLSKGGNRAATKLTVSAVSVDAHQNGLVPVVVEDLGPDLVLAKPKGGFKVGETYRFTHNGSSIEVTIGKTALGPLLRDAKLVETAHVRALLGLVAGASCGDSFDTDQAAYTLELPAAAKPYAGALLYTTTVDGQAWTPKASLCAWPVEGRSWQGPAKDIVFAQCGGRNAATAVASEGKHAVAIQASLPGTSFKTTTTALDVTLSCK